MDFTDLVPAVKLRGFVGGALAPTGSRLKPLLHFAVLGALLFGAKQLTGDVRALGLGVEPIVVTAADVDRLRAEWRAETRREPSRSELEAAIRHEADEQLLVREALRLGLDRSDRIVRDRLVRNLRFARGDDGVDDAALLAEAIALDMARRDVVARRRLIQAMEERLAVAGHVTDMDVRDYVAAHPGRYAARPRITFDQVFLANQPGGSALLPGAHVAQQSEADLARTFGDDFARAAVQAAPGEWTGPIRSAFGVHVIRVSSVTTAAVPEQAVLRQARYALMEERERAAVRASVDALRSRYPVRVEWPALAMAGAP